MHSDQRLLEEDRCF